MMSTVFLLVLCWRWLWAWLSRTWYVPDETWQSVEVAHRVVWGTGHLTWEWREGIRSSIHPLLFSLPFQLMAMLGLDSRDAVVLVPKLVQGALTAVGDVAMYRWVERREGRSAGAWHLLLSLTNWHSCYSGSRTLINTLETSLLCLSLPLYPSSPFYLPIAAAMVMIRPTAAITWLPLLLLHLHQLWRTNHLQHLLRLALPPIVTVLAIVCLDSWFYNRFTFVPLNFFQYNVLHNLSSIYGTHPPWWYLTNALIPTLGPLLIPIIAALPSTPSIITAPSLTTLLTLSLLPHKEMRFLQPILPLLLYPAATKLAKWTRGPPWRRTQMYLTTGLSLLAVNAPIALYLSLVHQRGVVDVVGWASTRSPAPQSLQFLMPCHSTPLYSHIHKNITTRFLTCEPNLLGDSNHVDEADEFYRDPMAWLHTHYPLTSNIARRLDPSIPHLPTIALFDVLQTAVQGFLDDRGYVKCSSHFHANFAEGRVGREVLAFCPPSETVHLY